MAPAPASSVPPAARGLRFSLGVLVVAAAAAAFAIGFRATLELALGVLWNARDVVTAMERAPLWTRVASPALGGLVAGLLGLLVTRAASGHGVGDVMEAVVLGRIRLSMATTVWKCLASWFAIVFGGSIGREGPLIQFGGAAGKLVGERLGLQSRRTRVLIAAGTAAGFAAAYNTPFAAVLFVLEVVIGVVVLDAVVPVLVATVIATVAARAIVGEGPIYGQREFALVAPSELFAFAGLGLFAALGAQAFMRLLSVGELQFRKRLPLPLRPALGGLLAGSVIAFLPEVAGNGFEPLNGLLDGKFAIGFILLLLVGKPIATVASVSSGSPGGVFTPTLLVGGCIGFVYGTCLGSVFGVHVGAPGGYALVGMAAAIAASTHAPLMAAVMVFELSGDYAIALPLVLATALATFVSRVLRRESIYTAELRERGVEWEWTLEGRRRLD